MKIEKRELPPDLNRRTGRSTRQADELIQELFDKETIFFQDHAQREGNRTTECLARKIYNRMRLEHPFRPIYVKRFGLVYGITIKFSENQKERAFMFMEEEFDRVKSDWR